VKGLNLRSLSGELHRVEPEFGENPAATITDTKKKLNGWHKEMHEWWGGEFSFSEEYHRLPLKMFSGFSFDEFCKLRYSSRILMDKTVCDFFETHAQHEVVRKIESSMWRWSHSEGTWNEVVEAYDCLRRFTFVADPDFEVRLDYSTYHNPCGYSKFSRVFIDGALAYLVYYKRKHVMTIGFSILADKHLLIQQVQSAQRTGNRYLYKLPANRIEFVIDLFRKNFPLYTLHVIDGGDLARKLLGDYRGALERTEERYNRQLKSGPSSLFSPEYTAELQDDCELLRVKIRDLETNTPKLDAFYRNAGRFKLSRRPKEFGRLRHRRVLR
jgi:hypothetical protein